MILRNFVRAKCARHISRQDKGEGVETRSRVRLSQVFRKKTIVHLTKRGKAEAITECIEHLVNIGKLRRTRAEKTLKIVLDREKIGSTGIGEGIAVPHAELEFLNSFLGVLGISKNGVDYKSVDGRPVNYIFMFLTPCDRRHEHQEILRDIVTFVREGNYMHFLKNADSPEEIHDLFIEMEEDE